MHALRSPGAPADGLDRGPSDGSSAQGEPSDVSRRHLAVVVLASLFAVAISSFSLPVAAPAAQNTPEHVHELAMVDTSRQRRAHKILLVGTAIAALAFASFRRVRERCLEGISGRRLAADAWALATRLFPFVVIVGCALTSRGLLLRAILVTAATVLAGSSERTRRWGTGAAVVVTCAYAALMTIPALLATPALPSSAEQTTEWHYSVTMSEGDRLAHHLRLFDEVTPHYGLLGPLILSVVDRTFSVMSFAAHLRVVQVMQIAFCAIVGFAYARWNRTGGFLAFAIVFVPILGAESPGSVAVLLPNLSAWRFLGLALGVLILVSLRRVDRATAALLGLTFGALLVFNPETAIPVGIGYVVLLGLEYFASPKGALLASWIPRFVLGTLAGPAVFAVAARLALGAYPVPHTEGSTLTRFAAGYGGLRVYFDVSWIAMLAYVVFVILDSAMRVERLDQRDRVRTAIAVVILVWFAYFFNRAHPWNLSSHYFLYGFFIIDMLSAVSMRAYREQLRRGWLPIELTLVMAFVFGNLLQVETAARSAIQTLRQGAFTPGGVPEPSAHTVVSGVRIPTDEASSVEERARFLEDEVRHASLSYFTHNMFLMPLESGVFPHLPMADVYVESFTVADFDRAVRQVREDGPEELLFDDPVVAAVTSPERRAFFDRFKGQIASSYAMTGRKSGWEIWNRTQPAR